MNKKINKKEKKNNKNKKSQTEIMGLMMVVILIVVGIMIFLVLSLNSTKNKDIRQVYLQKQIAYNTLTAISRTNLPSCGVGVNIGDLIKECYKYECLDEYNKNEGEGDIIDGCLYLNISLDYMLNKTIGNFSNYNYEFFVYDSDDEDYRTYKNIYINKSLCIYSENKDVGIVQIPYDYGKIKIMRLEVC